jgi:hypothetical protein
LEGLIMTPPGEVPWPAPAIAAPQDRTLAGR